MASNVVVLHNNRRHVIKTTPSMLCRDILTQACEKIGYKNVENYGLKNGKNTVDLALPVRLANLAAGAKLEIYKVNASEAMKPITLALQCSDPPIRLTGTFSPTATLTEVLLHFEQESNGQLVVFGRRGEEAVLSVLGREFGITEGSGGGGATTLAGMGVGGNVLVRLGFRKIGSSTTAGNASTTSTVSGVSAARSPIPPRSRSVPESSRSSTQTFPSPSTTQTVSSPPPSKISPEVAKDPLSSPTSMASPSVELAAASPSPPAPAVGPGNRKRVVYTAASASTPTAANLDLDDSIYNMTTEQAKSYQAHLTANAKSYSERTFMTREMREAAEREKASKRCDVRVRFPDGTQVQGSFNADENVGDIYQFIKEQLDSQDLAFQLHLVPNGHLTDMTQTIRQAGFAARTLLMFNWSRDGNGQALRDDVLRDAVNIEGVARSLLDSEPQPSKGKGKDTSEGSSKHLPKWLSKLTKK